MEPSPPPRQLRLGEIFDLEAQLYADRDLTSRELDLRDRRIALEIGLEPDPHTRSGRHALFLRWLAALPRPQAPLGSHIERGFRLTRVLLWAAGLTLGATTVGALLRYDGTTPVNVLWFLGSLVGLQLLLLLGLALASAVGVAPIRRELATLFGVLARRWPGMPRRADAAAGLGRIRNLGTVYADAERWLLLRLGQGFGLAFNLGALVTGLGLIAFSDLAFRWSTTLQWTPAEFHQVLDLTAKPWTWALPKASPSLELVEASRYIRLEGAYQKADLGKRALDSATVGQWWRYLFAALAVYGLLPRLLLWIFAGHRLNRALGRAPLNHGEFQDLFDRLTRPRLSMNAPNPESPRSPHLPGEIPAATAPLPVIAECAVVFWGEIPLDDATLQRLLENRLGWSSLLQRTAGGEEVQTDRETCATLAQQAEGNPLLLVVESFDAATREMRQFLNDAREALGPNTPIVVGLLRRAPEQGWTAPRPEEELSWRRSLEAMADPYLRVIDLTSAS